MKQRTAVSIQLLVSVAGGFLLGFSVVTRLDTPVAAQLAITPQMASAGLVFGADAGLMLKFIRPDKTADFEATIARLREALEQTSNPERRQQAAGWKVFRAVETATNGDVVYVFEIEPTIKSADYNISKILAESFPAEAPSLYRRYADSYPAGQNIVNLTLIAEFGDDTST